MTNTIRAQVLNIEATANSYARDQIQAIWAGIKAMDLPVIEITEAHNNGTDYLDPLVVADLTGLPHKLHLGYDRDRAVLVLPSGVAGMKNDVFFERYTPGTGPFIIVNQRKGYNSQNEGLTMLANLLAFLAPNV